MASSQSPKKIVEKNGELDIYWAANLYWAATYRYPKGGGLMAVELYPHNYKKQSCYSKMQLFWVI